MIGRYNIGGAFQNIVFTPVLHQRCGVGDDDRRKSRLSPVA